ncbi:helix-turn-helix domain-containing protein [uncultured Alistipes sp.]|jgi:mobilizable transposon, xis protein|uniref:helix-turn-helix domain-containing protein n=1 Tax=uncultured Alistipes sp. TaxID=538949 RepID=UPI0025F6E042|nr:helix-turn-helix domain-containing protein [uncultured Alistipes sp.]
MITFDNLPQVVSEIANEISDIKRLLLEKGNAPQSEADQLLTIQQAAKLLNLSVPTIYGYVHRAEIPVCKRGKRLFFSKQELLAWVKEGRKKTATETAVDADNYLSRRKGDTKSDAIY